MKKVNNKNTTINKAIIGVIGGRESSPQVYKLAYQVGQEIAKSGSLLICGGKGGVMEASCKGAKENGGTTIGILPGDDVEEANPYIQIPIASGIGIARNVIIVKTAQAIIAINGRHGTLSEIAFARQLKKPVCSLEPWLDVPGVVVVKNAQEAVEFALTRNNNPE
jgi:uncharacterized protein (TIGR00725 family)